MLKNKTRINNVETSASKHLKIRMKTMSTDNDTTERRRLARLDVPINVHYKVIGKEKHTKGTGVTKNVSVGNCLLLVTEKLSLDTEVELQIFLGESESEFLTIHGRIARINRSEDGLYEYGIKFDEISREARRLFADYFFSKMYEMIGLPEWPTNTRIPKKNHKKN